MNYHLVSKTTHPTNLDTKTILKSVWWILILVFISLFLYRNLGTAISVIEKIPVATLSLAFLAILVAKTFLVEVMRLALLRFDIRFSYRRCFEIYNITQLGKYIPGSIWQFVGRITLYREHNLNNKTIRNTLLVETFWVVFSAFVIGTALVLIMQQPLLMKLLQRLPEPFTQPIFLWVTCGLMATFALFWRKALTRYFHALKFNLKSLIVVLALWICLGFSFWITLTPLIESPPAYLYIVGLYALSYAVGFVVPFAPAGIGIREAILVTGLIPYLDTNSAVVLATINRIFYLSSEVGLVLVISSMKHKWNKETDKS